MKRVLLFCLLVVVVVTGVVIAHNRWPALLQIVMSQTIGHPTHASLPLEPLPDMVTQREKIVALGRLEPQGEIISIGAPSNDRLGRLLIKEGQHVESGETLAYLESYAERLAEKDYAESQLLDAKARLAAETAFGKSGITEAKIRVRELEELPLLDIRAQEAKVRQLEADLALAKKDLERFRSLQQRGTISQQDVDHQVLMARRIQEEITSTAAMLVKLKAAYDVNLLMAKAQMQTAQDKMARAQTAIQLTSLTKNLALAQARLSRAILKAPIRGRVLQIFIRPGERIGTQPVLTIGNTEQMRVVAEVYETDVRFVRVGQRATVSSPALTDVLTGTVAHIGSTIANNDILSLDPAAATDTRVVDVKIQLQPNSLAARLINLQVDVEISLIEEITTHPIAQRQ